MIYRALRLVAFGSIAILLPAAAPSGAPEVPYPDGYRHWTHIKTAYIGKGSPAFQRFGGMHNIYANAPAMEGYRKGRFPVGALIVFDVLDATSSEQGVDPGVRKFVDVMLRRADGQWAFGEFDRDSRTKRNVTVRGAVAQCQGCHDRPGATDGVFSKFVP